VNKNHKSGIFDDPDDFSLSLPSVVPPDATKDLVDLQNHHKEFFGDDSPLISRQQDEDSPPAQVEPRQVGMPYLEMQTSCD
jgi:hypothetical protein